MTLSGWSLRGRLVWSLTLGITFSWLVAAGLAALAVRVELYEEFDSLLQETAQHLLPSILAEQAAILEYSGMETAPPTLPAVPHDEYITYQILAADGRVRLRSHQAPMTAYVLPAVTGFAWDPSGRRVYTEFSVDGRYAIEIAEPAAHRTESVLGAILMLLMPLLGLVPVAIWLIWRSVRHGLKPVLALQREISNRSRSNLQPFSLSGLPEELGVLVGDVNKLLHRLAQAMESERSFAANSAHELRTPVAAAMAQTELLALHLGETTPLGQRALAIVDDLRRMSQLAERLLQLSRAEAGTALAGGAFDMAPLLVLLVEEASRQGGGHANVSLDRGEQREFVVEADLDMFGIAIRNLLDNALLHGAPGSPVIVRLGPGPSLGVVSSGPVVPKSELITLTERFRRLHDDRAGSGLGLAIVDTIMRQLGGSLRLFSPARGMGEGFEAVLTFPQPAGADQHGKRHAASFSLAG